jgi:hypothetical protein
MLSLGLFSPIQASPYHIYFTRTLSASYKQTLSKCTLLPVHSERNRLLKDFITQLANFNWFSTFFILYWCELPVAKCYVGRWHCMTRPIKNNEFMYLIIAMLFLNWQRNQTVIFNGEWTSRNANGFMLSKEGVRFCLAAKRTSLYKYEEVLRLFQTIKEVMYAPRLCLWKAMLHIVSVWFRAITSDSRVDYKEWLTAIYHCTQNGKCSNLRRHIVCKWGGWSNGLTRQFCLNSVHDVTPGLVLASFSGQKMQDTCNI